MEGSKRDVWLDCLRGVAVLLVLGRHLEFEAPSALTAAWYRGGWVGVDLFFVLSGFLVSGLLFREYRQRRAVALPRFLIRRGLRIYPAFYALLLGTWLLSMILPMPRTSFVAYLAEMLFVQNYLRGVWPHTWSLAVEEHFYLGLPIVLLFLLRIGRGKEDPFRPLLGLTAAMMIVLAMVRCMQAWWMPFTARWHLYATHLRADALWAGVCLSYICHFHRQVFNRLVTGRRVPLLLCGSACFVPAFLFPLETTWFIHTLGLTLHTCGGALLIAANVGSPAPPLIRWLAPVGRDSYSIYLWHMPVLVWLLPWGDRLAGSRLEELPRIIVYVVAALLVGAGMARITEWPVLRLRDRWFPSRTTGKSTASPSVHLPQRHAA
jgi:peptidoglycan/LPS O-acetylase OafA/YrhL